MANEFLESIQRVFDRRVPGEGEYLDPRDGLIHCAACGAPRQRPREQDGHVLKLPRMCDCMREQLEAARAEQARRDFEAHVQSLRATGLRDAALVQCTFENDLGLCPEIARGRVYVENWQGMRKTGTGMLLWGGVGTGKTFIAGCVANALIDRGVRVTMTNFARVLNALTDRGTRDRNAMIDDLNAAELLIIDDLGVERTSEFALEQVYNVIDSRLRTARPMIVTTNLTLRELKEPGDIARQRIYSRVLERCVPIRVDGRDLRGVIAAQNLRRFRECDGGAGRREQGTGDREQGAGSRE